MTSVIGALVCANLRYWTTVAPRVRAQLARWKERATKIEDPRRRSLALDKLSHERFNPRLAATLTTIAPRARRDEVTEAIVALQVAYDYLDALGEHAMHRDEPAHDVLGLPFKPAAGDADGHDDDYLRELIVTARERVARLPAAAAVREPALRAAERCGQAQTRGHAIRDGHGLGELERWARAQAHSTGLGWREWLAGAQASVLCLHALIAAAADPCTSEADADALDELYLRIGALTMLDSVIDRAEDSAIGTLDYQALYESGEEMGLRLAATAHGAIEAAGRLRHGPHHRMTLEGVVAYYSSAPAAREPHAQAVLARLQPELGGPIGPTLVVMRTWRLAERLAGIAAVVLAAGAIGAGGATVSPRAHAAHTLKATDTAHLHYISASGSLLFEEGRAGGTLPGSMKVHMRVEGRFSGSFTFYVRGGAIRGHGSAIPKGASAIESFAGTLTVTGGSGRFRQAHGIAKLYGTFNRNTYALVVQTVGTLYY